MEKGLISVIVPVYNTADYLHICLNSILSNTYKNLEVICVNDGSKDNSSQILRELAEKDSRVKIIEQENQGVSVARNNALDAANGEYISFVDSDDWLHPQYYEILLYLLEEKKSDIAVCQFKNCKEYAADFKAYDSLDTISYVRHNNASQINGDDRTNISRALYRAEVIGDIRFKEKLTLCEDVLFNVEVFFKNNLSGITVTKEKLYYYYQREDSAVHSLSNIAKLDSIDWYLSHIEEFKTDYSKKEVISEAVKSLLWLRFCCKYSYNKKELREIVKPRIEKCNRYLDLFGNKKRKVYGLMLAHPFVYKAFRIYQDKAILLTIYDLKHPHSIEENKNKKWRKLAYNFLSKL